ncbi:MAG: hypothetical protein DRH90_06145 [Deltaproteobacteria bacterium]|nr:MAG: hypothetical protein DRH90_06145 [Deltaproteobacteria bacterium]RLC13322.1 MAG: hypothetical protein DRI24_15960 [Deltaproteobacteria bacterium]HHE74884.1 NusG domain II-containing protein [Desulfobacteraceae bacterium]
MDSAENIKKKTDLSYIDILIAVSIVLFGLYWLMMRDFNGATDKTVVIYKDDDVIWTLPMQKDRIIQLEPFGVSMVVEIRDQKVRVLSSSCQQQICVRKGWTGQVHNPIICIPNKITIDVTGADPGYDAITR